MGKQEQTSQGKKSKDGFACPLKDDDAPIDAWEERDLMPSHYFTSSRSGRLHVVESSILHSSYGAIVPGLLNNI